MIVQCHKALLVSRCHERGYPLNDCLKCIIDGAGEYVLVDTEHQYYPHRRDSCGGPGTELSKLLNRFGIKPTPTCQCRAKAAEMDRWGPDECERPERIEEVVAVMREEAAARGLPFLDAVGRLLVRRAIRNARRAAAN